MNLYSRFDKFRNFEKVINLTEIDSISEQICNVVLWNDTLKWFKIEINK